MNVRFPIVEASWSMPYQLTVNAQIEQAFDKINEYALIPGGGSQGQVLAKASARAYDATWANPSASIPYRVPAAAFSVAQSDGGTTIYCNSGAGGYPVTLPVLSDTTALTLVNNNGGPITLSPSGCLLYWYSGSAVTAGSRTLAVGGVVTLHFISGAWRVWGTGIS
jgi:hypothetical protein